MGFLAPPSFTNKKLVEDKNSDNVDDYSFDNMSDMTAATIACMAQPVAQVDTQSIFDFTSQAPVQEGMNVYANMFVPTQEVDKED